MKKLSAALLSAAVIFSPVAFSSAAYAAPPHQQDRWDNRKDDRRDDRRVTVTKKTVVTKRWSRGHRLSPAERRHLAEVRDYKRYRLSAPPRGYRWVRADNNQYLLIGITSGLISSIIAGR